MALCFFYKSIKNLNQINLYKLIRRNPWRTGLNGANRLSNMRAVPHLLQQCGLLTLNYDNDSNKNSNEIILPLQLY